MISIRLLMFCVAMLLLVGILVSNVVVLESKPTEVDVKNIIESQGVGRSYNNTNATKFLRWMGVGT